MTTRKRPPRPGEGKPSTPTRRLVLTPNGFTRLKVEVRPELSDRVDRLLVKINKRRSRPLSRVGLFSILLAPALERWIEQNGEIDQDEESAA